MVPAIALFPLSRETFFSRAEKPLPRDRAEPHRESENARVNVGSSAQVGKYRGRNRITTEIAKRFVVGPIDGGLITSRPCSKEPRKGHFALRKQKASHHRAFHVAPRDWSLVTGARMRRDIDFLSVQRVQAHGIQTTPNLAVMV